MHNFMCSSPLLPDQYIEHIEIPDFNNGYREVRCRACRAEGIVLRTDYGLPHYAPPKDEEELGEDELRHDPSCPFAVQLDIAGNYRPPQQHELTLLKGASTLQPANDVP